MAELKITRCKVCTSPLKPGATRCGKCGAEHSIEPAIVNPLRFTPAQVQMYRAAFEEQVRENPQDANALYAAGLTYLGLKNYELAADNLQRAVRQCPDNPDVYYYCALCFFRHRSVVNLSKEEMERIEEWLQTATQMQPKRKYLILQMILRQGMSSLGLNIDSYKEMPAELLERARVTSQEEDELLEIEQHVVISDEATKHMLETLANSCSGRAEDEEHSTLDDAANAYFDICDHPTERDTDIETERIEQLLDPEQRCQCLDSMYEPEKPEHVSHPSFFGNTVMTLFITFILAIVFIVLAVIAEFACDYSYTQEIPVQTAMQRSEARISELKAQGEKLSKEQLKYIRESAKSAYSRDSAKLAVFDSIYCPLYWSPVVTDSAALGQTKPDIVWGSPTEEDFAAHPAMTIQCVHRGTKGTVGTILYLAVPVAWLIFIIYTLVAFIQDWRAADRENLSRKNRYQKMMEMHRTRPTVEDYKLFCMGFVGPNAGIVPKGDMVALALKQASISEQDVANGNGKIYFFACFIDRDDNGEDTTYAPDVLSSIAVDVCVALKDSIICMNTVWDTFSDEVPTFEEHDVMYNRITDFQPDADIKDLRILSDGKTIATVSYGWKEYPSLFQYQSINPRDGLTYSRTRTSNFNEFKNSLLKMHSAYMRGER